MILFKRAGDLTRWLQEQKAAGKTIGFVPTMGALHAGHISLIDISRKTAGLTVCSIFVNPTQFNDPKDFSKYPITIEKDILQLERGGTDVLFLPEVADLYPAGTGDLEKYDLGRLESLLEGKYRPGHFQGVCQVVRRLLDIVAPDELFMGQKDYQQCMVVSRLLAIRGYSTRLHPCPIGREPDGLAMSSRNMRLTESERKKAPAIYQALLGLKEGWRAETAFADGGAGGQQVMGDPGTAARREALIARAKALLEQNDFRVDYVEIADALTLEPLPKGPAAHADPLHAGSSQGDLLQGDSPQGVPLQAESSSSSSSAIALIAAFQGEIRLIDNMLLN